MPVAALGTYAFGTEAIAGEAVHGQPTVAITSPTANFVVSAALPVVWTYTANPVTTLAQGYYRLKLYSGDRSVVFYDTGWVTSAAVTDTIPISYFSDTYTYIVGVIGRPVSPDDSGLDDSVEATVTVIADFADVSVYPDAVGVGCRFASRCPHGQPRCRTEEPPLTAIETGHHVACLRIADGSLAI